MSIPSRQPWTYFRSAWRVPHWVGNEAPHDKMSTSSSPNSTASIPCKCNSTLSSESRDDRSHGPSSRVNAGVVGRRLERNDGDASRTDVTNAPCGYLVLPLPRGTVYESKSHDSMTSSMRSAYCTSTDQGCLTELSFT